MLEPPVPEPLEQVPEPLLLELLVPVPPVPEPLASEGRRRGGAAWWNHRRNPNPSLDRPGRGCCRLRQLSWQVHSASELCVCGEVGVCLSPAASDCPS